MSLLLAYSRLFFIIVEAFPEQASAASAALLKIKQSLYYYNAIEKRFSASF